MEETVFEQNESVQVYPKEHFSFFLFLFMRKIAMKVWERLWKKSLRLE